MSSNPVAITNHTCAMDFTKSCHITMMVALVAIATAVLVCHAYPTLPLADFISKNQIIFLSVGGSGFCMTLALHILAICKTEEPSQNLAEIESLLSQTPPQAPTKKLRALHVKPAPNLAVHTEKGSLRKKAMIRLENAQKACEEVNWRQFALMNNTSLIRFSAFDEGLQPRSALCSHLDYLDLLKRQETFFSIDKGEEVVEALIITLNNTQNILSKLSMARLGLGFMQDLNSRLVFAQINEQLHTQGHAYFLTGYCGREKSPGHAAVCKIEQKPPSEPGTSGNMTLYFLNLGEGIQYHPELNVATTHIKTSRCFYPSQFSSEEWYRMGETFICHLLRYASDAPEEKKPYSMGELYDLQSLFAPLSPSTLEILSPQMEGKAQAIGDCADKAVRNILIDFLSIEKHLTDDQAHKVFLNLHMASIVAAYHSYQQSPNFHHQQLLVHASEEFASMLLRSQEQLERQEYLLACEMIDVILNSAKKPLEALPPLSMPLNHAPLTTLFPLHQPPQKMQCTLEAISPPCSWLHVPPPFRGKEFKQEIKRFLPLNWTPGTGNLEEYLTSLPIPQWENSNDPWNQVPLEDIKEILTHLYHFVWERQRFFRSQDNHLGSENSLGPQALSLFTFYVIIDKLARRAHATTQLQGFGSPFFVDKIEGWFVFFSPQDEERYLQIKTYFSHNQKSAKGKIIFPVSSMLNFPQYEKDRAAGKVSQETALLDYLDQFISYLGKLFRDYATTWEKLPFEVHALYYSASLAHVLGNQLLAQPKNASYMREVNYQRKRDGSLVIPQSRLPKLKPEQKVFLRYYERSTNEVLCTPKKYKKEALSRELLDELTLLNQHPQLKVGLALLWMQAHPQDLNNPTAQECLECCFFSPGVLQARIEALPDTIPECRAFIKKYLVEYRNQPEHLSAILFLIRLGITFESYVAKITSQPIDENTLFKYEKRLKGLLALFETDAQEHNYLKTLIHYIYPQKEVAPSEKQLLELYTYLFTYGMLMNGYCCTAPTLNRMLPSLHYQHLLKLRHFLALQGSKQQETLNTLCNGILLNFLQGHLKEPPKKWQWTSASTCTGGGYVLEFRDGTIFHTASGAYLARMRASERDHYHYQHLHLNQNTLWWWHNSRDCSDMGVPAYVSLDDTILLYVPDQLEPGYLIKKNEKNTLPPPLAVFNASDYKTLYFLNLLPLTHQWTTGALGQEVVVSYHRDTQKPFVQLHFETQGVSVTRLDEQGNPLPYKLANLENLAPLHPLFSTTLQFAPFNEQLCFIHEKTGEIEELYFPRLHLTFKKTDQGLEANDSGYFFTPMPLQALQGQASHAIVLRHPSGKLKVILPAPQRETLRIDTKKKKDTETQITPPIPLKYKVYPLRSAHDDFPFDSLAAQLFFVYFFKVHGAYERAYSELKKIRNIAFDKKAFDILNQLLSLSDHSPCSLAFNLRLVLFTVDHFHHFKEDQIKQGHALFARSTHWYASYLRAMGEDLFNAIAYEWRLTEEEESRILIAFTREEIELPKILCVRDELLHTVARSATIHFSPTEVPLSPFSEVLPPHKLLELGNLSSFPYGKSLKGECVEGIMRYPNRLTHAYLIRHFPTLYQQAQNAQQGCSDPFDFVLLALFKVKENYELASLLFYIRHFPRHFSDLSFSRWQSEKAAITTFKVLVDRVGRLAHLPECEALTNSLKKTICFDYQKSTTLTLPPQTKLHGPLPEVDALGIEPQPFVDLFEALFRPIEGTSYAGLQLFEDSLLSEQHPLEQELRQNYEKAYGCLSQEKITSYQLDESQLDRVARKLHKKKDHFLNELVVSEKKILEYVNDPYNCFHADFTLDDAAEFRLSLNAHQTYQITPEMIMGRAILKNSTLLFDEHRPMLQPNHIQIICEEVHHYYHLKVLNMLCEDALGHITTLKGNPHNPLIEKELRTILNYTFLYIPEHYPEIAYMKIQTGKMPRPEQVLIYKWVCEGLEKNENRLFQLPAGGGKTSYLIPLMILRCKRHHLVASVLTTQAMYSTEKENLSRTLSLLEEELDTLEVGMHTDFSLKKLKILYQNLKKCLQQGSPLLVVPQTFYSLRLAYFTAAVEDEKSEKTVLLQKILSFLKTHVLLLGDESHRNMDPMTQAVFGIGNFVHLSQQELTLLFELMKPVLGIPHKGQELRIDTLQALLKGKLDKETLQKIKQILASSFSEDPAVISFLTDKKVKEPLFLAAWQEERRYLALMTRYFLGSLLPKILKMRTDFDHVLSQEQGEIDTPAHHKTPSHAQFRDPYLTSALSIKGTWQRGLNLDQLCALIERLKKQNGDEQTLASLRGATPSQKRFQRWVGANFPTLTLQNVDLKNEAQLKELFSSLKKHPEVVEYYLNLAVLSHIGYSTEQFTSTPAHLMDMCKCSVIFSATPLRKNAYPQSLKQVKYDPLFETRVIAQASKAKNQKFIYSVDVPAFFTSINQNRDGGHPVRYMIDGDGFLCNEMNQDVATRWLQASNLEGVIYFKEGKKADEESLCLLLRDHTLIELKGTDNLQGQLAYHNINWDTQAIGVFFDAPHAESANFPAIPHSAAYILTGGSLTLSHAIQTLMRCRGFLDDAIDQRIIWVVPPGVNKKREAQETFHSRILFSLFLQNEVKSIKNSLLMAAFQEIAFKIESIALAGLPNPSAAIKKHADGFRDVVKPDQTWESNEKLEDTDAVLWSFAKGFYQRFRYATPFDEQTQLKEDICQIITAVHTQIAHVLVDFHNRAVTEMHQKCMIQEQMQKLQYPSNRQLLKAESLRPHKKITDQDYLSSLDPQNEAGAVFKTPHLTPKLYLEWNQLNTARTFTGSLKEKFLKPIHFLMIVIQGPDVYAEAVSNNVLIHHLEDLKNPPKDLKSPHQVLVLRADGVVYQEGAGSFAPSKEQKERVLSSLWLQDVLIDVALLKGKILNNDRFFERIQKWPQFIEFWGPILKALPHSQEHSLNALRSYLPESMREMSNHLNPSQGDTPCLV